MKINLNRTRRLLNDFEFDRLFVEELGWSRSTIPVISGIANSDYDARPIAELAGVVVMEIASSTVGIPDARTRKLFQREVTKLYHENLLIFVDQQRSQSLWYWVKRVDGKSKPYNHYFSKGQPADLFLGKLNQMVFELSEFESDGPISVVEVANRLRDALDVEQTTKKFFGDFQIEHVRFLEDINGLSDERQRRWYASVLINRLMFIYFLQMKPPGFLDGGNTRYLRAKLEESKKRGKNRYYKEFLQALFFEGFAKPKENRTREANELIGEIKYLNGGLFLPHKIEQELHAKIKVPDQAFENLFDLFERYTWHLDDTPGGQANEINPDVLGYIFEKYINQKAFGAYYTRTEITEYLCERTINRLILEAVAKHRDGVGDPPESVVDMLLHLDAPLCKVLLEEILPGLSLLDPACGSGAFLVAAMKTLISIYSAVIGRIKFLGDAELTNWLANVEHDHPNVGYFIKKRIITDNLFGVDIMEEATEIAKLRLFLALVASAESVDHLEPLPNIDFNVMAGNSLIGLIKVDESRFDEDDGSSKGPKQHSFLSGQIAEGYRAVLDDKAKSIALYREHSFKPADDDAGAQADRLLMLRDAIQKVRHESIPKLNWILLGEFKSLGIKFEQATWDDAKGKAGKAKKRALKSDDIESLRPFHWGFEFSQIINERGGFDAIITNPPWEIFKPIAKEFCYDYDPEVQRRGTDIKDFEKRLANLLSDSDIRKEYLDYVSNFPHQSAYYRSASEYENQISVVNGKKSGTDINLYKLFVERCFHLIREGGECGIVIPSGIYSDLGTMQLRKMLFSKTQVTGLFGFENRKEIFEGVHRSFKFVVLTFEKGGNTTEFPAAFMRLDVADLLQFPENDGISVPVKLIERLSPDSLSVMEFSSETDVTIAKKMQQFPLLGQQIESNWNIKFTAEFHMTNSSHLFHDRPASKRLPLYEGKMIWLFDHGREEPRYYIEEREGRAALLSARIKQAKKFLRDSGYEDDIVDESDLQLGYEDYRLGFRAVTGATNERALVVSIIPPRVFAGNSLIVTMPFENSIDEEGYFSQVHRYSLTELLCCAALMGSFVCDWSIRQKILTNMNMFYVYQLPIPRLQSGDEWFNEIVERAAKLICTTPDYDELANEAGIGSHRNGITDHAGRQRLRAEIDGIIAHIYRLTESEFAHILKTFHIVPDPDKIATRNAFRDVERGLIE